MFLANVILATLMPYAMVLFFCFLVVPLEGLIFFALQRRRIGLARSLGVVALANVASWFFGLVITAIVPVPNAFAANESKPEYLYGIVIGFIVAFFLSWRIEQWVLSRFWSHLGFFNLSRTICIANLASYVSVFIAMIRVF